MICSLDISSKKAGIALFEDKGQYGKPILTDLKLVKHNKKNSQTAVDRIALNVPLINYIISNLPWDKIDKVIVEMTPIPGYSGRLVVLYVGLYLNAIYSYCNEVEMRICKPLDWQDAVMGTAITRSRDHKRDIKKHSMNIAYENNVEYKDREVLLENDDLADAVNMGQVFYKMPFWHITKDYMPEWSSNKKGKKRNGN